MTRVYNFNPGPAILPREVIEQAQAELPDYHGTGMSILEISHRSAEYESINAQAESRIKSILGLGDEYRVLFIQGGASTQFSMVPMNFLAPGKTADYILTGTWSEKARDEAAKVGNVHIAATTQPERYCRIPSPHEIGLSDSPEYLHITSNNTLWGTQWHEIPDVG
ncbi:MAG: aminotransferase class V-fold PLP-dependent enzyme, partial [Chloroflexota bacterium]|nr:aminotransferase class V-fold PLP-dependent enzyme [Chloroflexota bacterium]